MKHSHVGCMWQYPSLVVELPHYRTVRNIFSFVSSSVRQGYSRELFQFEEDRFDNVPALIRFYVGGRQPISQASGAVIFHPITRTLPLRVISERLTETRGAGGEKHTERSKRRSFSTAHTDTLQIINPLLRWEEICSNVDYCSAQKHTPIHYADGLYFMCSRSGSQPSNLENVGRRPSLQSAQSDSNLRTGTLSETCDLHIHVIKFLFFVDIGVLQILRIL